MGVHQSTFVLFTQWQQGYASAAEAFWRHFTPRLVAKARRRISDKFVLAPENAAYSAIGSFLHRYANRDFEHGGQLWLLFLMILENKIRKEAGKPSVGPAPVDPVDDNSSRTVDDVERKELVMNGKLPVTPLLTPMLCCPVFA